MELPLFCVRLNLLLLLLAFYSPRNFIQSPMNSSHLNFLKASTMVKDGPLKFLPSTSLASMDFGRLFFNFPAAVLRPKSPNDISSLLSCLSASFSTEVSVAARGAGHSIHGQAQAPDGIVIEMDSLPSSIEIHKVEDVEKGFSYADVAGGVLWIELLEESLKFGLAPRSWTDYLYLSIGGTLSNAGISGQTFKYGPQISNVLQLEVVTGKGEIVTCSLTRNAELFYAILGGLGQFGIITKARILLQDAPKKVKWIRAFYDDFRTFTDDQELLISMPQKVDYVEGFIILNENSLQSSSNAFPAQIEFINDVRDGGFGVYYCLEFAVHDYQRKENDVDQLVKEIASDLKFLAPFFFEAYVSYYDFLNRVRSEETSLRSRGLWDVPHPWLNMFVPKSGIEAFTDLLLQSISRQDFEGPILIYPFLRGKWDANMSAVLPETTLATETAAEQVVYAVGVLQSTDPKRCGASCLAEIIGTQRKVVEIAASGRIRAKQYLSRQPTPVLWREHFGSRWDQFAARKSRFDPMARLGSGQGIFTKAPCSSEK
ncbi:hypothetical protein HPP92_007062 [Vanilla planifolia]|uniref:cytokinin dehydrogenase n=1 Tax=Vanilla planifolia TaxID=51239 RepID=A0A835RJM0_VANPL|nr:hypothetical protein HPP92_007062 [Vanilla planifolia]